MPRGRTPPPPSSSKQQQQQQQHHHHNHGAEGLLRAHRAPLRLLFATLDARQRGATRGFGDKRQFFNGYFSEHVGDATPLGWAVAATVTLSKEVVLEAASYWTEDGRQRAAAALAGFFEARLSFAGFERFFAEWATPGQLRPTLRIVARECCAVVSASRAPKLRAPWWLLGRGEAANDRQPAITLDELRDVLVAAFEDLRCTEAGTKKGGFLVEDAYALCRDAAIMGETLSSSAMLSAFEASASSSGSTTELDIRDFAVFVQKVALLWWRGESGCGAVVSDFAPAQCFIVERLLPLLAARQRHCEIKRPRLAAPIDAPTLELVREHDMALRCLFVAYCSKSTSTVPLVALLRFARDFRLLTAAQFSPAAVVDCARAARHPNQIVADATNLRWPEFVETLLLLGLERTTALTLAESFKQLLNLMDPGGRIFFVSSNSTKEPLSVEAAIAEKREQEEEEVVFWRPTKHVAAPTALEESIGAFESKRVERAEETQRCLEAASDETRRLAEENDSAELRQMADGVKHAVDSVGKANEALLKQQPVEEQQETMLPTESWPPPPRRSPEEIWLVPQRPVLDAEELRRRQEEREAERLAALDACKEEADPWWWVSHTFDGTSAARHVAATILQRHWRGAALRRRLALLRDRLLSEADERVLTKQSPTLKGVVDTVERRRKSVTTPSKVEGEKKPSSDERAVIHAFALAALIGDGSPRRIARAKVLVETLRSLPEIHSAISTEEGSKLIRQQLPEKPRSLEELEEDLRNALARVAIEENRGSDDEYSDEDNIVISVARREADLVAASVRAHPGFAAREAYQAALFEMEEKPANEAALAELRSLIPSDVAHSDREKVTTDLANKLNVRPDSRRLLALAKRLWTERSLWLVHASREATSKTHVADLRSRYGYHRLDVTELRAVYAALPHTFEMDPDGAKLLWRAELRARLVEAVNDEPGVPQRHAAYAILSPPDFNNGEDDNDSQGSSILDDVELAELTYDGAEGGGGQMEDDEDNDGIEWRECFDENYKRVYFFNTRSGESRWTPPEEPYRPLAGPTSEDAALSGGEFDGFEEGRRLDEDDDDDD